VTPVRVLVVDDAVVIRRMLADALDADPGIEVVGTASNGRLALQKLDALAPEVITLDIEMPEMDGLETLRELRRLRPRLPVIMFSTLTERGAAATLDALALGASDYVTKPANVGSAQAALERVREELAPRIKALAGRAEDPVPIRSATPRGDRRQPATRRHAVSVVAIGTSTGGPNALETVLGGLAPGLTVPVLIVQHMPPVFTRQMAERLDARSCLTVVEATDGMPVRPGWGYVAPGGLHMAVERSRTGILVRVHEGAPENSCRPAVDVLFRSVADCYRGGALGVVMTGMGQDGLRGCAELVDAGATVLAQDEATSVVWGMPGYVARHGLAAEVLPLDRIAAAIDDRVRMPARQDRPERRVPA
jgi:two-component system, chemotaxis family, protein-glutamate methylesterase/glutaminase